MKFGKKLKNRRGMTLVEVLTVVAIMAILLGVAMPNLLAAARFIKMTAMNGYARAVAVAVQSKLYGMKNAGTSSASYYALFNENAALDATISTDRGSKKNVKYVSNFGEKGMQGKQYLLSGALTDTEVLQEGNIVVVYDPETADVLETYYSENEFDASSLFPASSEAFLETNVIGVYCGENAPAPSNQTALPTPVLMMENGEELIADIYIPSVTNEELLDQEVAFEIYVADAAGTQAMIYGEGFYAMEFTPSPQGATCIYNIARDNALTLRQIEGKTLKFAVDSIVLTGVPYVLITQRFLHSTSGTSIFCEQFPSLYPRASLLNQWLSYWGNAHYSAWLERNSTTAKLADLNVGDDITITVVMHALTGDVSTDGRYREFYDDNEGKLQEKSEAGIDLRAVTAGPIQINGFFESASERADGKTEVRISCVRHLQNLCFDGSMWTFHGVTNQSSKYCAILTKDISGGPDGPWYQLLSAIRADLIKEYGDVIKPLFTEENIHFAGSVRRLGGSTDFEFDGMYHTISGLCINAIAWGEYQSGSNFNDFFGQESWDYRDFFQKLLEIKDDSALLWNYLYVQNPTWFHDHAGDCLAVFPLKHCTLRDMQDDQTTRYYIEPGESYVYP